MRDRDSIYQDILQCGRRRAEDAWMRGQAARANVEKSHLGCIPALLHCDDERRHRHYLEVDRFRFLRDCKHAGLADFDPLWTELTVVLAASPQASLPGTIPMTTLAGPAKLSYRSPNSRRP